MASEASKELASLLGEGPPPEITPEIKELAGAGKTFASLLALVPIAGARLIRDSELHSPEEKRLLGWVSYFLGDLLMVALVTTLPTSQETGTEAAQRIKTDLAALREIAINYRHQKGVYPDAAVWARMTAAGQPHFYDPWGRAYEYDPGTRIATLGRDAVQGGGAVDADVSIDLP